MMKQLTYLVRPVFGRPVKARASRPRKYYYENLPGPDGEELSINILYRSKRRYRLKPVQPSGLTTCRDITDVRLHFQNPFAQSRL
jgi:hypothetical protein